MRRIAGLFGAGLLACAIAVGAIACGDDDAEPTDLSATPTAISQGTPSDGGPSDSTEPAPGETEPADGETPEATGGTDATPPAGANAVSVNLIEYILAPDPDAVSAGTVTFTATNTGGTEHELLVIKTDLAPESLPAREDGSVDGEGDGIEVLDETGDITAGDEAELSLELEAGAYVLVCNIVQETTSHYAEGMRAAFTVQ